MDPSDGGRRRRVVPPVSTPIQMNMSAACLTARYSEIARRSTRDGKRADGTDSHARKGSPATRPRPAAQVAPHKTPPSSHGGRSSPTPGRHGSPMGRQGAKGGPMQAPGDGGYSSPKHVRSQYYSIQSHYTRTPPSRGWQPGAGQGPQDGFMLGGGSPHAGPAPTPTADPGGRYGDRAPERGVNSSDRSFTTPPAASRSGAGGGGSAGPRETMSAVVSHLTHAITTGAESPSQRTAVSLSPERHPAPRQPSRAAVDDIVTPRSAINSRPKDALLDYLRVAGGSAGGGGAGGRGGESNDVSDLVSPYVRALTQRIGKIEQQISESLNHNQSHQTHPASPMCPRVVDQCESPSSYPAKSMRQVSPPRRAVAVQERPHRFDSEDAIESLHAELGRVRTGVGASLCPVSRDWTWRWGTPAGQMAELLIDAHQRQWEVLLSNMSSILHISWSSCTLHRATSLMESLSAAAYHAKTLSELTERKNKLALQLREAEAVTHATYTMLHPLIGSVALTLRPDRTHSSDVGEGTFKFAKKSQLRLPRSREGGVPPPSAQPERLVLVLSYDELDDVYLETDDMGRTWRGLPGFDTVELQVTTPSVQSWLENELLRFQVTLLSLERSGGRDDGVVLVPMGSNLSRVEGMLQVGDMGFTPTPHKQPQEDPSQMAPLRGGVAASRERAPQQPVSMPRPQHPQDAYLAQRSHTMSTESSLSGHRMGCTSPRGIVETRAHREDRERYSPHSHPSGGAEGWYDDLAQDTTSLAATPPAAPITHPTTYSALPPQDAPPPAKSRSPTGATPSAGGRSRAAHSPEVESPAAAAHACDAHPTSSGVEIEPVTSQMSYLSQGSFGGHAGAGPTSSQLSYLSEMAGRAAADGDRSAAPSPTVPVRQALHERMDREQGAAAGSSSPLLPYALQQHAAYSPIQSGGDVGGVSAASPLDMDEEDDDFDYAEFEPDAAPGPAPSARNTRSGDVVMTPPSAATVASAGVSEAGEAERHPQRTLSDCAPPKGHGGLRPMDFATLYKSLDDDIDADLPELREAEELRRAQQRLFAQEIDRVEDQKRDSERELEEERRLLAEDMKRINSQKSAGSTSAHSGRDGSDAASDAAYNLTT